MHTSKRDTLRLKQRLCAALASFSLLGTPFLLVACDDASTTSEERITTDTNTTASDTTDTNTPTDATETPDAPDTADTFQEQPDFVFPPCGSFELTFTAARVQEIIAENNGTEPPALLDCPQYFTASPEQLSLPPSDFGSNYSVYLSEEATQALRDQGNTTDCVYNATEQCPGGRLLISDADTNPNTNTDNTPCDNEHLALIAPLRPGNAWSAALIDDPALRAEIAALPPEVCALLASHWHTDGQVEHASVASFARATLELMQAAAPPNLIAASQHAALDEIEHAKLTLSLAAHYTSSPLEPAHLPAASRASSAAFDLTKLATDVLEEGVIGESVACLALQRALDTCAFPSIRAVLTTLLDDESRHAALAWATLRWAISTGGPSVADAVRDAASRLSPPPSAPAPAQRPHLDPLLARHGRLSPAALFAARQDAWRDVISPMLDAALS